MDADDVTALILAAAADEQPQQPLDGVDLWEVPALSAITGTKELQSKIYYEQVKINGVDRQCECCGKNFRVHPSFRDRAFTCSHTCNQMMHWRRKKGIPTPDRPLWNKRWRAE